MDIKIGKSMLRNTAGDTRSILESRFPKASKKDIDAVIEKNYGKDKGAEKLNEEPIEEPKKESDGNVSSSKTKGKDSK